MPWIDLLRRCKRSFGSIDILVINHTGPALGLSQAVDFAALDAHYQLMVSSPLRLIARVLPDMRTRRWGRILSVGGGSMVHALPNKVMDNVFRPALVNYTKALANEIASDGVTVNMILPGTFVTDRVHDSTEKNAQLWGISVEEAMRRRLDGIPAGRFGELSRIRRGCRVHLQPTGELCDRKHCARRRRTDENNTLIGWLAKSLSLLQEAGHILR